MIPVERNAELHVSEEANLTQTKGSQVSPSSKRERKTSQCSLNLHDGMYTISMATYIYE
jgi:hypothetical protein